MSRFDDSQPPDAPDLKGYEVLVGVCGGIAAYKVCEVVSAMVQRGAGVTVAMTRSARKFVGPTTFEALSGRKVLTRLWMEEAVADSPHIRLTRSADLTLIAPATANILGKAASGIADDVVSTLVISAALPVVFAPAMNDRMWGNPIVQDNVRKLTDLGYAFIGPADGWLACRTIGTGRMEEAAAITDAVVGVLRQQPAKRVANVE